MTDILALQDLPSLTALDIDSVIDFGAQCTACSYTCSHTLSEG